MRFVPLLFALLLGACGTEPAPVPAWRGEGNLVEVTLDDIHCAGCEKEIEDGLLAVEGVTTVRADHVTKLVLVMLETGADRQAAIPALREAIHDTGRKVVGEDSLE